MPEQDSQTGQSAIPTDGPKIWPGKPETETYEDLGVIDRIERSMDGLGASETVLFFCVVVPLFLLCWLVSGFGTERHDSNDEKRY